MICGRIYAYQRGVSEAFRPGKHVWTFVGACDETYTHYHNNNIVLDICCFSW